MKFVHIADMHFDSPFATLSDKGNLGEQRRIEQRKIFKKIIEYIKENKIEYLFIAGDLYEHKYIRKSTIEYINNLFKEIENTKIFITPGNHDPFLKKSYYNNFDWNKNVYIFNSNIQKIETEDADIYGYGFDDFYCTNSGIENIEIKNPEKINILIIHGTLNGANLEEMQYNSMNEKILENKGFNYVALGHIHKPQILIRDNAAYAGALEPVDRNDLGDHGYIEGHLENGRLKTNFVPFACRSYEQIILMLREGSTQASLEDMLRADLASRGRMNIYRIIIKGNRAPELLLLPEKLKSFGYVTEVLDESRPAYDLEEIQKKYKGTLIGDYISYFLEKDRNLVEEKALYYGLQALLETSR